jgi:gas vesicle protein
MSDLEQNLELRVRPRDSETVSLKIPKDTLESLRRVAKQKGMSLEALLKFYIGKCLRQDLSQLFSEPKISLKELMDDIGTKTKERGLTPEILDELLRDD